MESLNLTKGMTLELTKKAPTLRKMMIGLGWDTKCDLDSIAYLVDENGKIKDTVYFGDKNHQGIYLNGDNRTGEGEGDDEKIFVTFNELPSWVAKIYICVNIYGAGSGIFGSKKDFSVVKGSFVRLVNADTNEEVCKYNLLESGKGFNAFHFADLVRTSDGSWNFETVGEGMNGDVTKLKSLLTR